MNGCFWSLFKKKAVSLHHHEEVPHKNRPNDRKHKRSNFSGQSLWQIVVLTTQQELSGVQASAACIGGTCFSYQLLIVLGVNVSTQMCMFDMIVIERSDVVDSLDSFYQLSADADISTIRRVTVDDFRAVSKAFCSRGERGLI